MLGPPRPNKATRCIVHVFQCFVQLIFCVSLVFLPEIRIASTFLHICLHKSRHWHILENEYIGEEKYTGEEYIGEKYIGEEYIGEDTYYRTQSKLIKNKFGVPLLELGVLDHQYLLDHQDN